MIKGGASTHYSTSAESDTSIRFGTTKLNQMSDFGDDPYAGDVAYEGADLFEVGNR